MTVHDLQPSQPTSMAWYGVADVRVTLESIIQAFQVGRTAEEIAQQYPSVAIDDTDDEWRRELLAALHALPPAGSEEFVIYVLKTFGMEPKRRAMPSTLPANESDADTRIVPRPRYGRAVDRRTSRGTSDLEQVTLDLAPIPLDEVLDIRQQYGAEHRAYARHLRQFIRDLAGLDQDAQEQAFRDRGGALADARRVASTCSHIVAASARHLRPWDRRERRRTRGMREDRAAS